MFIQRVGDNDRYIYIYIYHCITLPETIMEVEHRPLEDQLSSTRGVCSASMIVSGRVYNINIYIEILYQDLVHGHSESQLRDYKWTPLGGMYALCVYLQPCLMPDKRCL